MKKGTIKEQAVSKYNEDTEKDFHIVDSHAEDPIVDLSAKKTLDSILNHKKSVKKRLEWLSKRLEERANNHDDSKLRVPEFRWLVQMDKEPFTQYGTQEYFQKMDKWEKFFRHHYENNRHHPDHFREGILGFNLVDLCEFTADIISYVDTLHVGKAIEIVENQAKRFNLDFQITQLIKNTILEYFTYIGDIKPVSEQ